MLQDGCIQAPGVPRRALDDRVSHAERSQDQRVTPVEPYGQFKDHEHHFDAQGVAAGLEAAARM